MERERPALSQRVVVSTREPRVGTDPGEAGSAQVDEAQRAGRPDLRKRARLDVRLGQESHTRGTTEHLDEGTLRVAGHVEHPEAAIGGVESVGRGAAEVQGIVGAAVETQPGTMLLGQRERTILEVAGWLRMGARCQELHRPVAPERPRRPGHGLHFAAAQRGQGRGARQPMVPAQEEAQLGPGAQLVQRRQGLLQPG